MNQEKTTFLRNQIRLYESKKQKAIDKQPYDNAINTYKGMLQEEIQQ